ncbi:MAG TPA: amidohydrolase family protein [Nocardioidaceae bacterium]|nr:amidohydrolase family protein [Nocardioidaceae bacterium]
MTKGTVVDVHAHCVPEAVAGRIEMEGARWGIEPTGREFIDGVSIGGRASTARAHPGLLDVGRRLEAMDAMGVDVQVLSPWIDLTAYALSPDLGLAFARMFNEELVALAGEHPSRFRTLCTVPLQSPAAADELRYAVGELHMSGVEIATTVAGLELDDESLDPFWAAAAELGCLILIHPCASLAGRGVSRYFLGNLVGNPAETTIAVAHLIFGGVLARHPGLRICLVHGGGFLPYQLGRWDHAYEHAVRGSAARLDRPPSAWAAQLYYDTVLHSPRSLRHLLDTVGTDHVVLGTDYPFEMGDATPLQTLADTAGMTDDEQYTIVSANLLALLGETTGDRA